MFNFGLFSSNFPYLIIIGAYLIYYISGMFIGTPKSEEQPIETSQHTICKDSTPKTNSRENTFQWNEDVLAELKSDCILNEIICNYQKTNYTPPCLQEKHIGHYFCRPPPLLLFNI